MAEAWARMTRKPAVAMVTADRDSPTRSPDRQRQAFQCPGGLDRGCVGLESTEKLDLQDMSQLPVIAPMVKRGWVCPIAERIPSSSTLPLGPPRRPSRTGLPGTPLRCSQRKGRPDQGEAAPEPRRVRPTDPAGVREALEMLRQAKQPVVVAGSGVWYADAGRP